MRVSVTLLILFAASSSSTEVTAGVEERVEYLKQKLKKDLRTKHGGESFIEPVDETESSLDSYEFDDDAPITPIMERDEQKKDDKFKLKRLRTTTTTPQTRRTTESKVLLTTKSFARDRPEQKVVNKLILRDEVSKPIDIFYRKAFGGHNTPIDWLHCADMVSPYLANADKELTHPRHVTVNDHVVLRLLQLLSMNTTDFGKDEVYSVLYQISKLKIRIFSWDVDAMGMLFKIITKETREPGQKCPTFKSIKRGIKRMFDNWRLDRANTTRLLLQARIFRPPCIDQQLTGSTKFVSGSTITPPSTKKEHDSSDCQNRAHDHEHDALGELMFNKEQLN